MKVTIVTRSRKVARRALRKLVHINSLIAVIVGFLSRNPLGLDPPFESLGLLMITVTIMNVDGEIEMVVVWIAGQMKMSLCDFELP